MTLVLCLRKTLDKAGLLPALFSPFQTTIMANIERMAEPHRILLTTEILEKIFLYTDMRSVLTSARVSKHWHKLIKESYDLQAHLFFKSALSSSGTTKRLRNLLLDSDLWSIFYRQELNTTRRHASYDRLKLPFMDAAKEDAYLRQEARNWHRLNSNS